MPTTNYLSTAEFKSQIVPGLTYKLHKMSHGRRVAINIAAAPILSKISELQRKLVPIKEELQRADEAAKAEPCQCNHPLDATSPSVLAKAKEIEDFNVRVLASGGTAVTLVDVCHSSITRRCLINGCPCRKPMADETIGDYAAYQNIIQQIIDIEDNELEPLYILHAVKSLQGLQINGVDATPQMLLDEAHESLVTELAAEVQRIIKLSPREAMGFKSPTTSDAAVDGQAETTDLRTASLANPVVITNSGIVDASSLA